MCLTLADDRGVVLDVPLSLLVVRFTMTSLKLQKRLAASVLRCGQRKVWLDPNEVQVITLANSRMLVACLFSCVWRGVCCHLGDCFAIQRCSSDFHAGHVAPSFRCRVACPNRDSECDVGAAYWVGVV